MKSCRLPILLSVLVLLTAAVYFQVTGFDFLSLDDSVFIYQNPHLQNGLTWAGLRWALGADLAFPTPHLDYWQPVTVLSRMLDIQFFGMNPGGHHLMNLFLHLMNTLLVFAFIRRLAGGLWGPLAAAALFAMHPVQAEAVAWVSARKDLLSTFFGLSALLAYLKSGSGRSWLRAAAGFLFLLAVSAKPSMIMLPFLFIALDIWPLGRAASGKELFHAAIEKIPALFFSTAVCLAVLWRGPVVTYGQPLTMLLHTLEMYTAQLVKIFLPLGLTVFHGVPEIHTSLGQAGLSLGVLALITGLFFRCRKAQPLLFWGWVWFVVTLFPSANREYPQDRFLYFPMIGILVIVIHGMRMAAQKEKVVRLGMTALAAVLIAAAARSARVQTAYWKDDAALSRHVLDLNPGNPRMRYMLGRALAWKGHVEKAAGEFRRVYSTYSGDEARALAWMLYGDELFSDNEWIRAETAYRQAQRLNPEDYVIQRRLENFMNTRRNRELTEAGEDQ